jgi:hypothetical protein
VTPEEFVSYFKTQKAAAKSIGLAQPTIADWVKVGFIPWPRQCQIQVVTGGALMADPAPVKQEAAA